MMLLISAYILFIAQLINVNRLWRRRQQQQQLRAKEIRICFRRRDDRFAVPNLGRGSKNKNNNETKRATGKYSACVRVCWLSMCVQNFPYFLREREREQTHTLSSTRMCMHTYDVTTCPCESAGKQQ